MVVETRFENKDNLRIQSLADIYANEIVYVDGRDDYRVIVRFIIKKSKIKEFEATLKLLNKLGIRGRIVE